jgi:hypothetical protein
MDEGSRDRMADVLRRPRQASLNVPLPFPGSQPCNADRTIVLVPRVHWTGTGFR